MFATLIKIKTFKNRLTADGLEPTTSRFRFKLAHLTYQWFQPCFRFSATSGRSWSSPALSPSSACSTTTSRSMERSGNQLDTSATGNVGCNQVLTGIQAEVCSAAFHFPSSVAGCFTYWATAAAAEYYIRSTSQSLHKAAFQQKTPPITHLIVLSYSWSSLAFQDQAIVRTVTAWIRVYSNFVRNHNSSPRLSLSPQNQII